MRGVTPRDWGGLHDRPAQQAGQQAGVSADNGVVTKRRIKGCCGQRGSPVAAAMLGLGIGHIHRRAHQRVVPEVEGAG
jgi:hypothetical protein